MCFKGLEIVGNPPKTSRISLKQFSDGWMDQQMDGQTDGQRGRWTDRQTDQTERPTNKQPDTLTKKWLKKTRSTRLKTKRYIFPFIFFKFFAVNVPLYS